jgi:RNA methyltransferase, TrmH family
MERITSRHNPIVKRFRELSRAHGAGRDAEVLLDGAHLVHEALAAGVTVEMAAFADRQLRAGETADIAAAVTRGGGRVISVSDQVLAAMSPVQHPSGVVAIGRAPGSRLDAVFAPAPQLIAVLAGVQDPGNVGAIVRTAAASAATGVVAIEGSANPFGWKALRGAMGGTFRLPVAARGSLLDVVATARERGVRLIAAVPHDGRPLPRTDLRSPAALLLGGEGAGITETMLAAADETVTIPMRRPIESLNVAVAAALLLYEASRQRGAFEPAQMNADTHR